MNSSPGLVEEHDSWISVDPLVGCPYYCDYCYLGAEDWRGIRPSSRAEPARVLDELEAALSGRSDHTPVAIGNYTDMGARANWEYLTAFATEYAERRINRSLVVITKAPRLGKLLSRLQDVDANIVFFLSQSFAADTPAGLERLGVSSPAETLQNFVDCATAGRTAIHFWRPFLAVLNDPALFPSRITSLRDSGAAGSVVVGFKTASGGGEPWSPISSGLLTNEDVRLPGDERFPMGLWRTLRTEAERLEYPVWRNTSCALSTAARAPDYLFTYASWGSAHYCLSTTCPLPQRDRCLTPTPGLTAEVVLDEGLISDSEILSATHIGAERATATDVLRTKAWRGSVVEAPDGGITSLMRGTVLESSPSAYSALQRLLGVTGFVTVIPEVEPRSKVFARLHHVARVMKVSEILVERVDCDADTLKMILLLHELGRLPFAHNLESALKHDQGEANLAFLSREFEVRDESLARDIGAFHRKNWSQLSKCGGVALASDMIAGLIEDPLLLVAGLCVNPRIIPSGVSDALELPVQGSPLSRLRRASELLHEEGDSDGFSEEFSALFSDAARRLIVRLDDGDPVANVRELAGKLRGPFLRETVFPINNELVSRRSFIEDACLRSLAGSPDVSASLMSWTDSELASWVVKHSDGHVGLLDFAPRFDAIESHMPELFWR